jgi:hypothetical protein
LGTSLAELVDDLEQHLHGGGAVLCVDEAAGGLHAIAIVLRRLASDGLERRVGGRRESAGTTLASACERAGQAWPIDPAGRTGQLTGIIGDVIGLQRFELGCEARWWTTLRLASGLTSPTADLIAAHGPYADNLYLEQIRAAAADELQLGAAEPPDPAGLAGLDIRLPQPVGYQAGSAEAGAAEELTRMVAQLRPTPDGRQPRLTVRQVQSVIHAGAAATEHAVRQVAEHTSGPWRHTASPWGCGPALACTVHRGSHTGTRTHDPLLAASSRLCGQLARARVEPVQGTTGQAVLVIAAQLPHLPRHLDLQIRMLTGRAIARATALPVAEARLGAWLGNTAIRADAQQLQPTRQALHAAEVLSSGLAIAMSQQFAHCSPRPAIAPREQVSSRQGARAAAVARDIAEQAYRAQHYDLRL